MKAALKLLRYIKGTKHFGITYGTSSDAPWHGISIERDELMAFFDADWGSNVNCRKSRFGWITFYANGATSWSSGLQKSISRSTVEAEYVACAEIVAEIIYLRKLLIEFDLAPQYPTMIYGDNKGAMLLARNNVFHKRTKHIDISAHYTRERIKAGDVRLIYISTKDNISDIMTKPVRRITFLHLVKLMGIK